MSTCAAGPSTAAGGNILPPVKIDDVRPQYPEHLRPAGVAGTVTMTATIDRQGAVRELRNLRGPHPDLETAAADAVRQWEFTATLLNCEAIEVEMAVTVNFTPAR
jgi:protein TonB